jgi:acyl carrier protein
LPDPQGVRPDLEAAYIAPRTEVERMIVGIWQEVLRVDQVGVNDNFFDLGGHSLLMVQVQSRLQEVLKSELSIVEMFKYPTVGALASRLGWETEAPVPAQTEDDLVEKLRAGRNRLKQRLEQKQLERREG